MADTPLDQETLDFFEKKTPEKIEPRGGSLVVEPDQLDPNFWNKAGRLVLSAGQGVVNAVEETGDFIDENIVSGGGLKFGNEDGKLTFQDFIPKYVTPKKWKEGGYSQARNLPVFIKPKGLGENLTEGAARFITGMYGPSKFFRAAGLKGTIVKRGLRGMTSGAVADLTVFDPNEGRLSDMLVEFDSPVLNNAVTQYLATDQDDTEMEGRLKNVLEGMIIGGPLEILFGIKAYKRAKATGDFSKKEKIYKETGEAIQDLRKNKKSKKVLKKIVEGNKAIKLKEYLMPFGRAFKRKLQEFDDKIGYGAEEGRSTVESFIKKILNTRSFRNYAEVEKTIDDVVNRFDDNTKEFLETDVLKNKEAEDLAKILAEDPSAVLKASARSGEEAKAATIRMLATKIVIQDIALTLRELSANYVKKFGKDSKKWTRKAREEVASLAKILQDTVVNVKNEIRGAARVTQAGNVKVSSSGKQVDVEQLVNIIKNFDGNVPVIAKKISEVTPTEEIIGDVSKSRFKKIVDVFNSLYINSLLSGIFTHALNMKSGIYEALIKPLELVGGGLSRADLRAARLGYAQYKGMILTMGDTIKAVGLALRQGDAVLDPRSRTQDNLRIVNGKAIRPISGDNLGFDGAAGTAIDWIGNLVELPGRLLMTGDELLKQMNYRGRLYANALDNTLERGLNPSSKEGIENTNKIMSQGFDKFGRANVKDNNLAEDALQYSRIASYTNDLKGGATYDFGGRIQSFLNTFPEFRFLAPFIRTPTNLWRHALTRIPGLGLFHKQMQDLWRSGDRRARAEVIGRQMFGFAVVMYSFDLVSEQVEDRLGNKYYKITGNGPVDFRIKRQWIANGWQEYSIAVKNKDGSVEYRAYNRMDPRFFILGIMADIYENIENINNDEKENGTMMAFAAVARQVNNKLYLRGITEAADALTDSDPEKLNRYLGRVVGSYLPFSSFRNQGIPGLLEPDRINYEERGFIDSILERAGKGKDYLEPKRDVITGEPIEKTKSSIYLNPDGIGSFGFWFLGPSLVGRKSDIKEDPVRYEIARLRVAISGSRRVYERVELKNFKNEKGQTAADWLAENTGKIKMNGKNLYEQLDALFKTKTYLRASDGELDIEGGRKYMVKATINAYRSKALGEMFKQYPDLKKAVETKIRETGKIKRGLGDERITDEFFPMPFFKKNDEADEKDQIKSQIERNSKSSFKPDKTLITNSMTGMFFNNVGDDPPKKTGLISIDKLSKTIKEKEGLTLQAKKLFEDEEYLTIGYGRNNKDIKPGMKITKKQAEEFLKEDIESRLNEIQTKIPSFSTFSKRLQSALFYEYYRGSVGQSPKTIELINKGKFKEASVEFLNNDEYRNAVERNRRGIRKTMQEVSNALKEEVLN